MADLPSGPMPTPGELKRILGAERTGRPFLIWRAPDQQLRVLQLRPEHWRVTIGRASNADVPLSQDTQVSRTHALLERVGEEWTLIDDGLSRNGSYVNAERVLARQRLKDRDRLCFGSSEVIYRSGSGASSSPTASVADHSLSLTVTPTQRRVLIALCRPVHERASASPATNREIAAEVFLSVDAVKAHLRVCFERFGLGDLPQNEKRAQLVASVLASGLLAAREF
jgi:DNA-binding CsgD family transcriptional regulator